MSSEPHPAMVIPFIFFLLAIAIAPFTIPTFWSKHYHHVSFLLGLGIIIYYLAALNNGPRLLSTLADYLGFIALIGSLFTIAGGIHIDLFARGSPFVSVCVLGVGAIISNIIGTTGASMLLIRPFIRINKDIVQEHHVIFFIFIISNVGGLLTPLGDPPLFLGYLKGVPFFWLLQQWQIIGAWFFSVASLLAMFYVIDSRSARQPKVAPQEHELNLAPLSNASASVETTETDESALVADDPDDLEGDNEEESEEMNIDIPNSKHFEHGSGLNETGFSYMDCGTVSIRNVGSLRGSINFVWLMIIIFLVLVQEAPFVRSMESAQWCSTMGENLNWTNSKSADFVVTLIMAFLMVCTAITSYFLGSTSAMEANEFSFGPLKEVTYLFFGIFCTMLPPLDLLELHAAQIGFKNPIEFYWGSGALSSVLDNAPTYLNFMTAAMGTKQMSLENESDVKAMASDASLIPFVVAVSIGSVFFGANTYIGNGPNMMVKSIAESCGAPCPSFFRYIYRYTLPFLMPILIVVCFAFVH